MRSIKELFINIGKKIHSFLDSQEEQDAKIFWKVVPLTCLAGIVSTVADIFEGLHWLAILCGFARIAVPVVFLAICYRDSNKCRSYYLKFCFVMNCFLMPVSFLCSGGMRSAMPLYCFGIYLLNCFCTVPSDCYQACRNSLIVYAVVFGISLIFPDFVLPIEGELSGFNIALAFLFAALMMTSAISYVIIEWRYYRYRQVNEGLVDSLGTIIEFRSIETGDHIHNIRKFTRILLESANETMENVHFTKEQIEAISAASMLHDIGKIAVPDAILNKPGKLTEEEYEIMKRHPEDGAKMIESMKNYQNYAYYQYCSLICRYHHERYDGSGYPDRMKGEEIPLIAQLVGLADSYEALLSPRVYKSAKASEEAARIILEEEKDKYSPRVLNCFIHCKDRLDIIYEDSKKEKEEE